MLNLYSKLKNVVDSNDEIGLGEIFRGEITPPPVEFRKIPLDEHPFPVDKFLENFCWNIKVQSVPLYFDTWKLLIDFYEGIRRNSHVLNVQVAFQILYLVSKSDVDELFEQTRLYDKDKSECFSTILMFVLNQITIGIMPTVRVLDDLLLKSQLREFLKRPLIRRAAFYCLRLVFGDRLKLDPEHYLKDVDDFEIYIFNDPGFQLKGATLRDGVTLNEGTLPPSDTQGRQRLAEMFTRISHEFVHFLARRQVNDYSFCTPFKYDSEDRSSFLVDPVLSSKKLEIGRLMELVLFDDIQPRWYGASIEGAEAFLSRSSQENVVDMEESAETVQRPPALIFKSEHIKFKLLREPPSLSNGLNLRFGGVIWS